MPKRLTNEEFRALLRNIDVSDEEIAKYLRRSEGSGGGLGPQFEPDPELVEPDQAESAISIGNWWCRWRRRARFNRRLAAGEDLPVIVSEGDSWFQFPFVIKDVIDHLDDDFLVWSCGAAGDTAENMIFKNAEYMESLDEQADRVAAFLLSAAGNDVIGEDENGNAVLGQLLHRRTSSRSTAHDLVNKAALQRVLDRLTDAYKTVVRTIRSDRRFTDLPILIHGYDYALPYPNSGNDPRNPFWADDNEWLGAPMEAKGIDDPAVRREIVEFLIQQLYDMMRDVAATDPHVHVVDVAGTLTSIHDWADEIHATSAGFGRIAAKFRRKLDQVIVPRPGRVEESAAPIPVDHYPPIESPGLLIETRKRDEVDPGLLGFGDMEKFGRGFRRTKSRIALGAIAEAIIEEDDTVPYRFLSLGTERGRAVCKIQTSGVNFRGDAGSWAGTGFLVGPNVLLTNYHVLNTPEVASQATAIFNFQEDKPGKLSPTSVFRLNPDRLFIASRFDDLDYCFVWIDGEPQDEFGTIEFWRGSFLGTPGSPANIVHHPRGVPKRSSVEKNEIIDLGFDDVLVHYAADTDRGSSGAPVMNSEWRLFALHHASTATLSPHLQRMVARAGYTAVRLNEGIKTSAIAVDIDRRANHGPDKTVAQRVQRLISGTDSRTGFFGTLGRPTRGGDGVELVVDAYRGAPDDIDIAFWNIEWFNRNYRQKVNDVARIVADLNLDIWAFEETSLEATQALADKMRHEFDMEFEIGASEPGASPNRQTTTVMWNARTVRGRRLDWAPEIDRILRLRSDDEDAARFEAVEGKIFDRYPGLFRFEVLNRGGGRPPFDFNLVPVHLKARAEGAKRRRMASNVLATAIAMAKETGAAEDDWIIGGDFNAELATGQFDPLQRAGFLPMSAADERGGAITYLGRRYRSLIDSIFLSPDLSRRTGADDFMIVARDRNDPGFVDRVSDHRPVMIRLSLGEQPATERRDDAARPGTGDEALLRRFLEEMRGDPASVLEELAELLRN